VFFAIIARESPTLAVYIAEDVITIKTAVLLKFYQPDKELFIRDDD
jgi:hypothetical protein